MKLLVKALLIVGTLLSCAVVNAQTLDVQTNLELTRTMQWSVTASADPTAITLAPGDTGTATIDVSVADDKTAYIMVISGDLMITNLTDETLAVSDILFFADPEQMEPMTDVAFTCPDVPLRAGGEITCSYSYEFLSTISYLQIYVDVLIAEGVSGGTSVIVYNPGLGVPTTDVDWCVTIIDPYDGPEDTVHCMVDVSPLEYSYTRIIGPYTDQQCGEQIASTTVTVKGNDSGEIRASSTANVTVTVECDTGGEVGCVEKSGYWAQNTDDPTWNMLPQGTQTPFYKSDVTHLEALTMHPRRNVYWKLAKQEIGARLNEFNGATVPADIRLAMTRANVIFSAYTPSEIRKMKKTELVIEMFYLKDKLETFNVGMTTTPLCE